jgi:hypothetical protein
VLGHQLTVLRRQVPTTKAGAHRPRLARCARNGRQPLPDFSQRFTGTFDDDNSTIVGRWETSSDGSNWNRDFDLTCTRLR